MPRPLARTHRCVRCARQQPAEQVTRLQGSWYCTDDIACDYRYVTHLRNIAAGVKALEYLALRACGVI